MASQETEPLVKHDTISSTPGEYNTLGEYASIAVVVVENEDHQPIVVHDYSGPVLLEFDTLERHDSLIETISHAVDDISVFTELPPDAADHELSAGQATILAEIASMTKGLIGCGVLSLPAGISLCANTPAALLAANFWIVFLGAIFGYFCYLIAEICDLTGRITYRGIWQETIGHKGALAVSIANALKAGLADLAYATILAQTLNSLFESIGYEVPHITCLLLVTVCAILPLCMLKNLHVLAPFSILGTAGVIFTALAMAVRYLDGSYSPGGRYYDDLAPNFRPLFGTDNHSWTAQILPFVCMVYESYVMHYNSARFYTELKNRSLARFSVAVGCSFTLSGLLYIAIASAGFLTFGAASNGYILNNYSPHDPLANVSRLAIGLSTLMAYPIVFMGVRDGVLDMFEVPISQQTPQNLNRLTLILLVILTLIAIVVRDLGLINALGGGLVSTAIVFLFPTIMYRTAVNMYGVKQQCQVSFATGITAVGVVLGAVGAYVAVMNSAHSS